jgi:hypothetical protein
MIDRIRLAGLLKLELPGHTVLLCDGGTLVFGGDTYLAEDPVFGTIAALEPVVEGIGDQAPAATITFAPQDDSAVVDICSAAMQGSRLRLWIAEVDYDTGALIGTPNQQTDAIIDVPRLKLGKGKRLVEMDFVSSLERLFIVSTGNVLSGEFHRRVWPGERGCDNATGVETTFAWGVGSPPRGTTPSSFQSIATAVLQKRITG